MNEASRPLDAKIGKWLTETGYPLEMRVNRAFTAKFDGSTLTKLRFNTYYTDPQTHQKREVDQIVSWTRRYNDAIFLVTLVIECKSTNEPWVVFKRNGCGPFKGSLFDPSYAHIEKSSAGVEAAAFFARLALEGLLVDENLPTGLTVTTDGYSIVTAFKDRNSRDPADSAVRQVLSAATNAGLPVGSEFTDNTWYCYSVPVIITSSPLYEAYLRQDGTLSSRPVNVASVNQPIPEDAEDRGATVTIFRESALKGLLSHCRHFESTFTSLDASRDPFNALKNAEEVEGPPSGPETQADTKS